MDQVLEGLGDVPVNLGQLIERHIGKTRITPREADSLLKDLGVGGDEPNRGEPHAHELPDTDHDQGKDRGQGKDDIDRGQGKDAERRQFAATSIQPDQQASAESARASAIASPEDRVAVMAPAVIDASLESTSGLTPTTALSPSSGVDVRDLRSAPGLRKTTFTDGLTGLDDLPEFPIGRSPSAARHTVDSKHSPKPMLPVPDEDTDSFEILVDEEILELEAEDSIVEDSDDDA
jgi:hypothetical protein